MDNEIAFNEAIIEEREQGIHEIQQQIGEVNEIFKDLAVLVHEQGAMIGESCLCQCYFSFHFSLVNNVTKYERTLIFLSDDIGSNVENAHAATAQGKSQLAKAAKTQRSNSSLVIFLQVLTHQCLCFQIGQVLIVRLLR